MSALEKLEIAFVGGYSREQIKARLDNAMSLYDLPSTEENYSRAGSALVVLRRDTGHSEMAILDYMIRSHVPGTEVTFADAAGMSAFFLQAGDR